jgi:hypothetical protein
MKKILLPISLAVFLLATAAPLYADVVIPNPSEDYHYVFALHYTSGVLTAQDPSYSIATGPRSVVISGGYTLSVANPLGKQLVVVPFDPRAMADTAGRVNLSVPYQSDGFGASVKGPTGAVIVRIDLTLSATCNDDGVCSSSTGEDSYDCPADCGAPPLALSSGQMVTTPLPSEATNPYTPYSSDVVSESSASGPRGIVLAVVVALTLIGILAWRYREIRGGRMDSER